MSFSSSTLMQRMVGRKAYDNFLDDLNDGERLSCVEDILLWVDDEIAIYTQEFYRDSDLSASKWVQNKATILALDMLSRRRANESPYADKVETIYEQLNGIKEGTFQIPGIKTLVTEAPCVRNHVINHNYPSRRNQLDRFNSTGQADNQIIAPIDPFQL